MPNILTFNINPAILLLTIQPVATHMDTKQKSSATHSKIACDVPFCVPIPLHVCGAGGK